MTTPALPDARVGRVRRWLAIAVVAVFGASLQAQPATSRPRVALGVDVLLERDLSSIEGRRLGLVTNPSGVDGDLVPTVDRFARERRTKLIRLFGPEHGIRGDIAAGDHVADSKDPATGIPVVSLYGKTRRPSAEHLADLDTVVFDIQDVGSRTYTYASTLGEVMLACREHHKRLLVLDRPNPLGGLLFEGPVQSKKHQSFIGWGPVPVTHGMTFGELARFYDAEAGIGLGTDLVVVPMQGWRRSMVFEDTGLVWLPTSPHIPHALQAHLYVATGMLGGVTKNVSEGVGTPQPFEMIGAAFVDANVLARELTAAGLAGVRFRPTVVLPRYGGLSGQRLPGVQLVLTDARAFRPLRTALTILCTLERLWPGRLETIDEPGFLRHWTDATLLARIRETKDALAVEAAWTKELEEFAVRRSRHLLYR